MPYRNLQPAVDSSGETGDDGYASVGGTTPAALRAWLRHMREFTYQVRQWAELACSGIACAVSSVLFSPCCASQQLFPPVSCTCLLCMLPLSVEGRYSAEQGNAAHCSTVARHATPRRTSLPCCPFALPVRLCADGWPPAHALPASHGQPHPPGCLCAERVRLHRGGELGRAGSGGVV